MIKIHNLEAREYMSGVKDNTYTAIFCDPPYGLNPNVDTEEVLKQWLSDGDHSIEGGGYANKEWDAMVPPPAFWKEVLRISKPGAVLACYCGPRMSDFMSMAIRLGGWEKFDEVDVFGPSSQLSIIKPPAMPKSANISKQFDNRYGVKGKLVSSKVVTDTRNGHGREYGSALMSGIESKGKIVHEVREPASEDAITWHGYGTAFSAAHDIVLMFRKPKNGTYMDTAKKHGSSMLNIDAAKSMSEGGGWPKNVFYIGCDYISADDVAGKSNISNQFFVAKLTKKERHFGSSSPNNHFTVKPIAANKYIASLLLPPEEYRDDATLFVPFSGVGSEVIGSVLAGWRNVDGVEMDGPYCEIAASRAEQWMAAAKCLETNDEKAILDKVKLDNETNTWYFQEG